MYASITNAIASATSCSFDVAFRGQEVTIDPEHISSILNIPLSPNGLTMISNSLSEAEKAEATFAFCGFHARWD